MSKRLEPQAISEIRQRAAEFATQDSGEPWGFRGIEGGAKSGAKMVGAAIGSARDVPALLAEIDRLEKLIKYANRPQMPR